MQNLFQSSKKISFCIGKNFSAENNFSTFFGFYFFKVRTMKILEKDQTNTRIYIGYALALSELEGSYSKSAKKVLDMALESSSRSQSSQKSSFSSLVLNEVYVAKAGLELKYGQSDNALWTFSLMASNRYVCSTYVFIDLFHKKNREILLHN